MPRHSAASFSGVGTTHPKGLTSNDSLFPGGSCHLGAVPFAYPASVGFEFFVCGFITISFLLGGLMVES
jgi:hypothetical protein